MRVGIVGLPNAGKSTLFNAITGARAATAGYPFTTVDCNVARVHVPDERLVCLGETEGSASVEPAWIECVDIAGLVEGAHQGEGLGNQFLGHIREVDALIHVLRAFEASEVAHVRGILDPLSDARIVETEMLQADIETLQRRRDRIEKAAQSGDVEKKQELEILQVFLEALENGLPVRSLDLDGPYSRVAQQLGLISRLPTLYVVNDGGSLPDSLALELETMGPVVYLSALWEEELAALEPQEAILFREEGASPVDLLLQSAFSLLDLITFYTANKNQASAFRLSRGLSAYHAAGKVHSDMQRGFIRAEVLPIDRVLSLGGFARAREAGEVDTVGRDYVVRDGDVLFFRFRA